MSYLLFSYWEDKFDSELFSDLYILRFLDVLFLALHVTVILFNLGGWIWRKTRMMHIVFLCMTLISWIICGYQYGFGYCFLTDWHWSIKRQLGETGMPNSFIQYLFEKAGIHMMPSTTDNLTVAVFSAVIVLTIYVNWFQAKGLAKM